MDTFMEEEISLKLVNRMNLFFKVRGYMGKKMGKENIYLKDRNTIIKEILLTIEKMAKVFIRITILLIQEIG